MLALAGVDAPARVAALALAGAGLGAFVPVNNATIMRAAPPGHAGAMGGVLNMTRGIGTALGVAIASLLYGADPGLLLVIGVLAGLTIASAAALAPSRGG